MLLEKLKQQKSQENCSGGSHYLQDRRLPEKLFPAAPPYESQLFVGHSSPNKRASIDCPAAGHQYLPDLWKQPKTSHLQQSNGGGGIHPTPSNRPRSYSQGRAVQHPINLADLRSQQHPPFRELPQLPKFKGGKSDKALLVEMVADDIIAPKVCYHNRLDHATMMITPQYSTSTDEGIETDLEDSAAALCSPTQLLHQPLQRLAYALPAAVIKSHSQNLADHLLPCAVNQLQYESDFVSSLPSCAGNEVTKYVAECGLATNGCGCPPAPPPPPLSLPSSAASSSSWDRRAAFFAHNIQSDCGGRSRLQENCGMSPVNFREGRRASDGLMHQSDSVSSAAQQYCKNGRGVSFGGPKVQLQHDCGKSPKGGAGSLAADLHAAQKEHETLKMLYQSCLPGDELVRKQIMQTATAAESTARNGGSGSGGGGGEYRKDVPPRSPSAAMAMRFNYTDGYALDKAGLQQQLLQQRLLQHKRAVLQKQGAAFSQCSVSAAMAAAASVLDSPTKRQHQQQQQQQQHVGLHRGQPLYNKTAQLSPQHSGDGHAQHLQSDGSWQSLPHTMATCQINDFDSQANWLSVPDSKHHWYCASGQPYSFSKNYSQVRAYTELISKLISLRLNIGFRLLNAPFTHLVEFYSIMSRW